MKQSSQVILPADVVAIATEPSNCQVETYIRNNGTVPIKAVKTTMASQTELFDHTGHAYKLQTQGLLNF